jgi:hypothetical protein
MARTPVSRRRLGNTTRFMWSRSWTCAVVVKSNETGRAYRVGCGWSVGWLIHATSTPGGRKGQEGGAENAGRENEYRGRQLQAVENVVFLEADLAPRTWGGRSLKERRGG